MAFAARRFEHASQRPVGGDTARHHQNAIGKNYPALIGGSADLNPSTNTVLKGMGDFENPAVPHEHVDGATGGDWSYGARNLHFGVREHAMAAASNGLANHGGLRPYCATFFNFVDYLKPSLRLCALMELPVIYVFTHDSIGLGEDGPTHQPIEQLATLRATPHFTVIRPADSNESAEAWRAAAEHLSGPVALILTRQKLPTLDRSRYSPAEGLRRGAYILKDVENPDVVLIGTGSEDYFNGAWDFGGRDGAIPFAHLYNGAPLMIAPERTGGRYCLYRWHADNPVTFTRYLKHTMEHGHGNDRHDNFFSVCYWYQADVFTDFPALAAVGERIPKVFS